MHEFKCDLLGDDEEKDEDEEQEQEQEEEEEGGQANADSWRARLWIDEVCEVSGDLGLQLFVIRLTDRWCLT